MGFEQLLLLFSSPYREMGVLNPVVLAEPPRSMDVPQLEEIERGTVGRQPVRCYAFGLDRLVVQQALEQLGCGLSVPPALDHDVQDIAFVIDRAPQVRPLSADAADHFIKVPPGRRQGPGPSSPVCAQGRGFITLLRFH